MQQMGLQAIYPKPRLSVPGQGHRIYPYLLRDIKIECHADHRHCLEGNDQKYYQAWTSEGDDLFCYFASKGSWSKWGSWGIIEWYDEDPGKSPKFMATIRWAKQCGQKANKYARSLVNRKRREQSFCGNPGPEALGWKPLAWG